MKSYCSGIPRMKTQVETCCQAHDKAYGKNGTGTRAEADLALWNCLRPDRPKFGYVVYLAVRLFGWIFWRKK